MGIPGLLYASVRWRSYRRAEVTDKYHICSPYSVVLNGLCPLCGSTVTSRWLDHDMPRVIKLHQICGHIRCAFAASLLVVGLHRALATIQLAHYGPQLYSPHARHLYPTAVVLSFLLAKMFMQQLCEVVELLY